MSSAAWSTRAGAPPPRAELLERLRGLKPADGECEGIAQPPRPPALAAIPEADPSPYEPLHGFDADLDLGVGHVRPVREEERDDWTRRLTLPVFAAPGGEVRLWLTPGSVGADVLVETGFETASFIALQARSDGWLMIRFGGPLASGAGWVHRCHLAAATPRLEFEPWEKRLAQAGPLYFRAWTTRNLRKNPSTDAPVIAAIPADPNVYGMRPLQFRGDWMRVHVSVPSTLLRRSAAAAAEAVRRLGALAQRRGGPGGLVLPARVLNRYASCAVS